MVEGTARPYKCRGCTRRYKFDYGVVSHLQQCDQWRKLYYSQFASEPASKLTLPARPITGAPASSPLSPSFSSPSRNVKLGSDEDDDIRCICLDNLTPYGRPVNPNGPMVQCDMCDKWLHLECLGLTEDELPDLWHCGFCSGKYTLLSCGLVNQSAASSSKTPSVDGEFDDTSSDMTEVADFDEKDYDDEEIVTLSKRLCKRPSSVSDTPPLLPTPQSDNQMKPYQRPQIHLTKSHSFCGSPSKGADYETTAPNSTSMNSAASTLSSHLLTQHLVNPNVCQMPQLSRTVSDCVISSLQDARKRKRSKVPIPVRLKMRANSMSSIPAVPSSSVSFNSRNYVPPPSPAKSLTISSTPTPPKSNSVLQYPAQGFSSASPHNTPKLKLVIKSSNLATILEKDVKSSDLRRYIPQNETRSESSNIANGKVHIQSQQSSTLTKSKENTLDQKKDSFGVAVKGQQSSVKRIAEDDCAVLASSGNQNEIEVCQRHVSVNPNS
ncbi:hypothetical protein BKA69DRAFT_342207 [Paraphysoderma sedebokerense]|nr:hypothetical protein BKA69DRAFT_342207 [Paraphysoderma sedebokerense]